MEGGEKNCGMILLPLINPTCGNGPRRREWPQKQKKKKKNTQKKTKVRDKSESEKENWEIVVFSRS